MDAELEARRQLLRRNVRRLGVLELVTRVVGVGSLVGIALHAIVASQASMMLAFWLVLGLAYLVAAFRVRVGASLVARELWRLEGEVDATRERWRPGHPYRELLSSLPTARHDHARGLRIAHTAAVAALASGVTLAVVAISR